jgi:hypothetical protein
MTIKRPTTTYAKALYFEFHREPQDGKQASTFQVIVYPDFFNPDTKTYHKHGYFHRQLTSSTPKRPWSRVTLHARPVREPVAEDTPDVLQSVTSTEQEQLRKAIDHAFESLWRQLERSGFVLRQRPFTIEVSNVDMHDISSGSTPYAVIRRVNRSREALKFPAELV